MKQITVLSTLLLLFFFEQSFAQKKIIVDYEKIYHSSENKSFSSYYRFFASKDLSLFSKETMDNKPEESSFGTNESGELTFTRYIKHTKRNDLYIDIKKKAISQVAVIQNKTQQVNDMPPSLDWHITDESKEIGGYIAIKAEVIFRGRDFEAWFTPEIPISAGPWKLYGLPGLILEAEDVEGKWKWQARNIKYPADFDAELFVINPKDIDETLSLEKAMKQHLANQAKED